MNATLICMIVTQYHLVIIRMVRIVVNVIMAFMVMGKYAQASNTLYVFFKEI
jgi:hypothetical protein